MTLRTTPSETTSHHPATSAVLITVFWMVAAFAVAAAHVRFDSRAPAVATAVAISAIMLAAFAYMRMAAREPTVEHALAVGSVWLVMAIVAEFAIGSTLGHGWFGLLGSLRHPLLRNVLLFVWIFAPALFARYRNTQTGL